jgi:hypothetical protein
MGSPGKAFNMSDQQPNAPEEAAERRGLPPAARRALAEAEARRKAAVKEDRQREINGPAGEEPTRYGDWERGGRAIDF